MFSTAAKVKDGAMRTATALKRPEGFKVTYRRMKFPFEERRFGRYWHGGSPFRSLFWSQLSTSFEPGEKFFIDAARALKHECHDPALLEEIAEFCRQEGHHTAQHLKFDKINADLGIDVEGCRDRYKKVLDRTRERLDPMQMLAGTVALEHFTAGFAEQLFKKPHLFAGADPGVYALWYWHAAEEAEHKATCFDLYQQLGGGYAQRVGLLFGAWSLILWLALLNTHILLWKDKRLFRWDTLQGYWYLFGKGGLLTSMVPAFFEYFSPSFHPWQTDSSAQIRAWEAANRQYITNAAPSAPPAAGQAAPAGT
jgi:predicted metal-dependent hydrolase